VARGQTFYCPDSSRLLVESLRSEANAVAGNLTDREREVLRSFARGENIKAIAARLGVSTKTVHNALARVRDKLGEYEPAGLVRYAIKHGYVEEP
jgi:DNA-binding NarL/FixJ family response regulator